MSLLERLLGERYMERELAHVLGTIAATEADIRYLANWIHEHPDDPAAEDYRFLLRVDEGTLRVALRRRERLERRMERSESRGRRREDPHPARIPRGPTRP